MNKKAKIESINKKIDELKAEVQTLRDKPGDLEPGDMCEVNDRHLMYFSYYDWLGNPWFVNSKKNVGDQTYGFTYSNYTKIGVGLKAYLATDKDDDKTFCYIDASRTGKKPIKNGYFYDHNNLCPSYLGKNFRGQTFEDGVTEIII